MSDSPISDRVAALTECPGTPETSHMLALILFDHCTVCGTDRLPAAPTPRGDRWDAVVGLCLLAFLAVLLWGLWW